MTLVFALQWLLSTVKFWSCCLCFHRLPSKSKGMFLVIVSFLFTKFTKASNHYKRILGQANLDYANKRGYYIPETKALSNLLIVFPTKVNLLYHLYLMAQSSCFLHFIRESYSLKSFLRTLTLMTQVTPYLVFPLELISAT